MLTGKYKLRSKLIRSSVLFYFYFSDDHGITVLYNIPWEILSFLRFHKHFLKSHFLFSPYLFAQYSAMPEHVQAFDGTPFSLSCFCFCLMLPILHLPVYPATVTFSPLNPVPPDIPARWIFGASMSIPQHPIPFPSVLRRLLFPEVVHEMTQL